MAASLRLSKEGIERVELARCKRGWDADALVWYKEAKSSKATLKRFRSGEAVQQQAFIDLCKAVGIDNWEELVEESPRNRPITDNDLPSNTDNEIETWQKERFYGQFIGRSQELQELLKYLESEEKNKVLGIVGIVGIGGLGKSALCHQLVSRAYEAKLFPKIVWVRAKVYQYQTDTLGQSQSLRDSRLTLEDALKDIGQELKLASWIIQDTKRCQSEIHKIFNTTPHLIVIDGLEDAESPKEIATELRRFLGKSCLILTSRKSTNTDILEYKLNKLNREVSREFLKVIAQEKYANSQNPLLQATEAEMEAILKVTDGMPLAMKLLVSLLGTLELDRIIERLESVSEEQDLYNYLFEDSWRELQRQNAIKAQLLLISLSSRSKPIPIKFLYSGFVKNLSKQDVDDSLQKLIKLSLVDISPGLRDKQVSLHSFTARYFWETLKSQYQQDRESNA